MTESPSVPEPTTGFARLGRYAEAVWYALVAALAIVGEYLVLELWRADLRVPFAFSADAAGTAAGIKGMIENGWVWTNPSLGAPGTMNLLDYPGSDTLHWLIIKLLSVSGDAAMTMNLYYLLGFPLVALTCAWTLRRLGISRSAALAASILFAFLPYHFLRSEIHLFLSAYFMVPPLAYLAIGLFGPGPAFLEQGESGALQWRPLGRASVTPVVICVLGASTGIYYALFGCFFILIGAVYGFWRGRERLRLAAGGALIGVIFLGVMLNASPYIVHSLSSRSNAGAVERNATGAELYSLRMALMVLPVREHRIAPLAFVHYGYVHGLTGIAAALDNEADYATLGLLGTLGFIFLLLIVVFGIGDNRARAPGLSQLRGVAALNAAALLLASSGMFGTIIGVVFTYIRAYNRIVVFVAFFSLLAVAIALDWAGRRLGDRFGTWAVPLLAAIVVIIGVYDQTTPSMVPKYEATAREWASLGDFVSRAETGLAPGAMVFQLPYIPFPENPPVVKMVDYDHIKPYLRSSKIHWSYGAVKGRDAAAWNASIAALPAGELVSALRKAGFAGIWVDRFGYPDGGAAVVDGLRAATGVEPLVSDDKRHLFFSLTR